MKIKKLIVCLAVLMFLNCSEEEVLITHSIPLVAMTSEETGISFSNQLVYQSDINILEYLYYYNGGGVAVGDINNDGLEDIYFTSNQGSDKLYLNQGDFKFKDITAVAGIYTDNSWSSGVTMEDVNNDGFLDIFVSKVGRHNSLLAHNLLYINNQDQTFTESTEALGLAFSGLSTQAAFIDYDRDGDQDMFLLNHSVHSVRSYGTTEKRRDEAPLSGDRFYENKINEEEGRFVDVTQTSGIYSSPLGYGLAVRVADINNDGWSDIYVGNDFHENDFIYINNGDKTFSESIKEHIANTSRFTMGVDVADLNNDGLQDIFTTDMMPNKADILLKSGGEDTDKVDRIKKDFGFEPQLARNNFQLQNKNVTFSEIALMTNTYATDWSWSVLLADFDNDWKTDIFVSNGIVKRPNDLDYINYIGGVKFSSYALNERDKIRKEIIDEMPTLKIPNVLFKNLGDLSFESVDKASLGAPTFSTGAAYADLDNDGDLDLVTNNINQEASVYKNTLDKGGLVIQLNNTSNYTTKGSRIIAYSEGKQFLQELQTTKGFQSASTQRVHFGVPSDSTVDSLEVVWPNQKKQTILAPDTKEILTITYSEAQTKTSSINTEKITDFELAVLPFEYEESVYLDYERERLIPEKLSSEGPALVVEDFNGDGQNDIFIGGSRYQAAELWIAKKKGAYERVDVFAFRSDRNFEDVDAASIDIDSDGDRDLYVVSGGNDFEQGDKNLMDRIYLNDGNGGFTRRVVDLPRTNGGTVSVADFDQDGYEDLFVGSRSIPGAYGLDPDSYIIRNNQGKGLQQVLTFPLGMITDSAWQDIDADGLLDLIIVGDWMPITILKNIGNNQFKNISKDQGLGSSFGLWNAVDFADFDGDGRLDIIAGNVGENFKWKPTVSKPVWLYLDDFDENEQLDPIIFYNFFDTYVPFASLNKLSEQLPFIKKRFQKYTAFAEVNTVEQLTGKNPKEYLQTKYINELRSMVYLNTLDGFKGIPLPKVAQQSSIEDILVDQEKKTVSYVGNYFDFVIELGPLGANPGGMLSDFNSETLYFESHKSFNLPKSVSSRAVEFLKNNQFVIATQNSFVFLVTSK